MTEPYAEYDENETDDYQDEQPRSVTISRERIRSMEKDAKETRKLREQIAEMQRAQALSGLGVDLTERQRKALVASVEGELTTESARAAAEELGFMQPAPTGDDGREAQSLARMSEASQSTSDPDGEDPVARLERVEREGGRQALIDQIQKDGYTLASHG